VGGTEEVTIKDLAQLVKEMVGSESKIEYISYAKAYGPGFEDMQRRCPDIARIKELIDFEPKVDLRGIVQSVIDYYKD
jgi:UDP-glucose 4-epimerase